MTLTLTPREIAIAQGDDPDAVESVAIVDVDGNDTPTSEATETQEQVTPVDSEVGQDDQGEGKEADAASGLGWVDAATRDLAESVGMADEDLKDYADANEFRRAVRLLDRQNAKYSKPATPADTGAERPADESATAAKPTETAAAKRARIDRQKYIDAGYGETELALVDSQNALMDELEAKDAENKRFREEFTAFQQRERAATLEQMFNTVVDGFDNDRYGRTVTKDGKATQVTQEQQDYRRKLGEAAYEITQGIVNRAKDAGVEPQLPKFEVLLKRAELYAFGETIVNEKIQKRNAELAEQSRRRRPVANASRTRIAPTSQSASKQSDPAQELINDSTNKALYEKLAQESGSE